MENRLEIDIVICVVITYHNERGVMNFYIGSLDPDILISLRLLKNYNNIDITIQVDTLIS